MDTALVQLIWQRAAARCEYCQLPQACTHLTHEVAHVIAVKHRGPTVASNLALACFASNGYKGAQTDALDPVTGTRVALFHPRRQRWAEHFSWSEDGTRVLGRTPCGRATVIALQLNNWIAVMVRTQWVVAGWHPPRDLT